MRFKNVRSAQNCKAKGLGDHWWKLKKFELGCAIGDPDMEGQSLQW